MPDINIQQILESLKKEAVALATLTFKQYKEAASADALKLLAEMQVSIEKWALQLANGEISKADFEFLLLGQKDLIKMNALKEVGIALIEADKFKASLMKLITNTVTGLI